MFDDELKRKIAAIRRRIDEMKGENKRDRQPLPHFLAVPFLLFIQLLLWRESEDLSVNILIYIYGVYTYSKESEKKNGGKKLNPKEKERSIQFKSRNEI